MSSKSPGPSPARFRTTTDQKLRRWMSPESSKHPARMHLALVWEVVERFSKEGDWILDPMAGVGSTFFACLLGRNVFAIEIERGFGRLLSENGSRARHTAPMLGYYKTGEAMSLIADATDFDALPIIPPGLVLPDWAQPNSPALALVLTSPPYEMAWSGGGIAVHGKTGDPSVKDIAYSAANVGDDPRNIARLAGGEHDSSLAKIYSNCWKHLRIGGTMVLVVKNVVRNHQIIDLAAKNIALMQDAGFFFEERFARIVQPSFFRTLQLKKGSPDPGDEHVLVFKKFL